MKVHMYNSALELGIEVAHLRLHAEHAEHGPAVPITRAIKVRKVLQAMFLFVHANPTRTNHFLPAHDLKAAEINVHALLFPQQM